MGGTGTHTDSAGARATTTAGKTERREDRATRTERRQAHTHTTEQVAKVSGHLLIRQGAHEGGHACSMA